MGSCAFVNELNDNKHVNSKNKVLNIKLVLLKNEIVIQ